MSKNNTALIISYNKGYRVVGGNVIYENKEVKQRLNKTGYCVFSVRINQKDAYPVLVHRLVAFQKFGLAAISSNTVVRHLDSNPENNLEFNIDIGTNSDNSMDRRSQVRKDMAIHASTFRIKYNSKEVKKRRLEGATYEDLMREFNISSKGTVSYIINMR